MHAVPGAKTVPQIIHSSSRPFSFGIFFAVVDAQNIFRIVGHHPEESYDPHPEDGSGSSEQQCGGDSHDVAGADRGGKGRTHGLELSDGLIFLFCVPGDVFVSENTAQGVFDPVPEMGNLEYSGKNGHENTSADQKNKHGNSPDKIVDNTVDICDYFNHTCFPPVDSAVGREIRHKCCGQTESQSHGKLRNKKQEEPLFVPPAPLQMLSCTFMHFNKVA